jgi:hypothetical protein
MGAPQLDDVQYPLEKCQPQNALSPSAKIVANISIGHSLLSVAITFSWAVACDTSSLGEHGYIATRVLLNDCKEFSNLILLLSHSTMGGF